MSGDNYLLCFQCLEGRFLPTAKWRVIRLQTVNKADLEQLEKQLNEENVGSGGGEVDGCRLTGIFRLPDGPATVTVFYHLVGCGPMPKPGWMQDRLETVDSATLEDLVGRILSKSSPPCTPGIVSTGTYTNCVITGIFVTEEEETTNSHDFNHDQVWCFFECLEGDNRFERTSIVDPLNHSLFGPASRFVYKCKRDGQIYGTIEISVDYEVENDEARFFVKYDYRPVDRDESYSGQLTKLNTHALEKRLRDY